MTVMREPGRRHGLNLEARRRGSTAITGGDIRTGSSRRGREHRTPAPIGTGSVTEVAEHRSGSAARTGCGSATRVAEHRRGGGTDWIGDEGRGAPMAAVYGLDR